MRSESCFECRYAGLLRYAVDPAGAGKGLYFSYGTDLTLTQQRQTTLANDESSNSTSLADRADQRFFFNRQLTLLLKGLAFGCAGCQDSCTLLHLSPPAASLESTGLLYFIQNCDVLLSPISLLQPVEYREREPNSGFSFV